MARWRHRPQPGVGELLHRLVEGQGDEPYSSSSGRDTVWSMTGARNACMARTGSIWRNRPAAICCSR